MGAISNEVGRAWASFAAVWSFTLAYIAATLCYQIGQILVTPLLSTIAIAVCLTVLAGIYFWLKHKSHHMLSIPVQVSYR